MLSLKPLSPCKLLQTFHFIHRTMSGEHWTRNVHSVDERNVLHRREQHQHIDCFRFAFLFLSLFCVHVRTEKLSLVLIASGSCLISLIIIVGCLSMCCCVRTKKRQLPPADIIPKVSVELTAIIIFHTRVSTLNVTENRFSLFVCVLGSAKIENEFTEKERNTKDECGHGNRYTDDTNRWAWVSREQFRFVQHNDNTFNAKDWFDWRQNDFNTANH